MNNQLTTMFQALPADEKHVLWQTLNSAPFRNFILSAIHASQQNMNNLQMPDTFESEELMKFTQVYRGWREQVAILKEFIDMETHYKQQFLAQAEEQ